MTDVIVIGGGPAGMAAAIESAKNGASTILIERNKELGGILNQCIHNGFGLHYFNEELTGPEFAKRLEKEVKKYKNITVLLNTFVVSIKSGEVVVQNQEGKKKLKTRSIVFATGAREKTPASITLTGTRPEGVLTAGVAQKMVNVYGRLPGKNVVILGSGDIGLIMARRLTYERAKVKAILEINPATSGLRRNILQCVEDYNIPLFYKHTVFEVVGKDRIEGIYYGQVDSNYNPILSTRKFLKCDCLILSVGLVPETDLLPEMKLMRATSGGEVDEYLMTNIPGIFTCGNVLHIHDLVDNVCLESADAGKFASLYAKGKLNTTQPIKVSAGQGVSYVVPAVAYAGEGKFTAKFRLKSKVTKTNVVAKSNGNVLGKKFLLAGVPGEMLTLEVDKSLAKDEIVLEVET